MPYALPRNFRLRQVTIYHALHPNYRVEPWFEASARLEGVEDGQRVETRVGSDPLRRPIDLGRRGEVLSAEQRRAFLIVFIDLYGCLVAKGYGAHVPGGRIVTRDWTTIAIVGDDLYSVPDLGRRLEMQLDDLEVDDALAGARLGAFIALASLRRALLTPARIARFMADADEKERRRALGSLGTGPRR